MSLPAFTNEVGFNQHVTLVQGRQAGKYYDSTVNEIIYNYGIVDQYAVKPLATYSDHHRPTNWSRGVGMMLTNQPSAKRRLIHVGEGVERHVVIDMSVEDHITNHYVPFSYDVGNPGADNAFNASRTKALNKLKPDSSGWGENIGQGKKTCEELARASINLARFLLEMRRGNFIQAGKSLFGMKGRVDLRSGQKTAADIWLGYQYGIKPLLQDIHDLNKAAISILKKPTPFSVAKTESAVHEENFTYGSLVVKGVNVTTFRTQLNALMINPSAFLLDSAGLANPAEISWELVPWSFAIDWFIPVGKTLQAFTSGVGLQDNGGWTTSHTNSSLNIHQAVEIPDGDAYWIDSPGLYVERQFGFSRSCFVSWPMPAIYANENPYSSDRALNALALMRQLV
jgi:hypothetical protein